MWLQLVGCVVYVAILLLALSGLYTVAWMWSVGNCFCSFLRAVSLILDNVSYAISLSLSLSLSLLSHLMEWCEGIKKSRAGWLTQYVDFYPLNSCRFAAAIAQTMPLMMTVGWVFAVAMLIKNIVYEKETRLKEVCAWNAWFLNTTLSWKRESLTPAKSYMPMWINQSEANLSQCTFSCCETANFHMRLIFRKSTNEPFSTAERSERVENFLFRATREYTEAGIEQRYLGANSPEPRRRAVIGWRVSAQTTSSYITARPWLPGLIVGLCPSEEELVLSSLPTRPPLFSGLGPQSLYNVACLISLYLLSTCMYHTFSHITFLGYNHMTSRASVLLD